MIKEMRGIMCKRYKKKVAVHRVAESDAFQTT
jgi:hypothetical protein